MAKKDGRTRTDGTFDPLDVKARYAQARELLTAGRLEEATTEFVWLWQNMLQHVPSMKGARVSFMASVLRTLAKRHLPARVHFRALRDELTPVVDSGTPSRSQLQDWAVLCNVVGESKRVLRWFDKMGPGAELPREHEWVIECVVIPLLKKRKRWADIGRLYHEPLRVLESKYNVVADIPRLTSRSPESAAEIRKAIEQNFLTTVGTLYASLRAAARDVDARAILEEARKLMPGVALESAIVVALREARIAAPPLQKPRHEGQAEERTTPLHCSFCGKSIAEVHKLIAGPSAFICDECVRLCAGVLDYAAAQVLVRVPDGSVHVAEPTTPWRPFVLDGQKLEWCGARSSVRGTTPVLLVAVRSRGAAGHGVGSAFSIDTKPTRAHAKEIASTYLLNRE
jgi:hypothetical protein